MSTRKRYLVIPGMFGPEILDVDNVTDGALIQIRERYRLFPDRMECLEEATKRAQTLCDLLNREEEMRVQIEKAVKQ